MDGKVAYDELPKPLLPVSVQIDGRPAQVLYAGAAPALVAGVLQVNVRVPGGVAAGSVPLTLSTGRFITSPWLRLFVR